MPILYLIKEDCLYIMKGSSFNGIYFVYRTYYPDHQTYKYIQYPIIMFFFFGFLKFLFYLFIV